MGLMQVIQPFLVVWFGIHAFLFLLQRFLNRPNLPTGPGNGPGDYELLPTTTSSAGISTSGRNFAGSAKQPVTSGLLVKPFYVRFSTTALNSFFFRLGNAPKLSRFWRIWYGCGVAFGLLAMVLGWLLLAYAAVKLVYVAVVYLLTLLPFSAANPGGQASDMHLQVQHPTRFQKRDFSDESASKEDDMVLVPIIPGITLPLSHLPYYLIALLVSGLVHEAGHAVAAARERTQISSSGIILYILYPGAFVDISSRALAMLSPLQQLRVICAGVWHNIVLFVLAWIFLWTGALQLSFRILGWHEMNDGLSVVDVVNNSPLYEHLRVGSIISKVDDVSLKGDPLNIWSNVLLMPPKEQHEISSKEMAGFCIPKTLLFVNPSDCCLFSVDNPFGHSQDLNLLCMTPIASIHSSGRSRGNSDEQILAQDGQCVTSSEILASTEAERCSRAEPNCANGGLCYQPYSPYRSVVRIQYSLPSWLELPETQSRTHTKDLNGEQVVVYQGDPKDIWEAVQVTTMRARWSFLPLQLPNAILLTIRYTMSFSLALSILNIVPARHLDGHHALKAFASLIQSIVQSYKATQSLSDTLVECLWDNGLATAAIASSSSSAGLSTATFPKGARAVKGIVVGTTVLLGGVIVGSLLQMGRGQVPVDVDDDDDDFEPSTPHTIRHRHVSLSQDTRVTKRPTIPKITNGIHNKEPSGTILSTTAMTSTRTRSSEMTLNRKKGLSLRRPGPVVSKRSGEWTQSRSIIGIGERSIQEEVNPFLTPSPPVESHLNGTGRKTMASTSLIVLDSESECEAEVEGVALNRSLSNEVSDLRVPSPQIDFGGAGNLSHEDRNKDKDKDEDKYNDNDKEEGVEDWVSKKDMETPRTMEAIEVSAGQTQESICSSQGSVENGQLQLQEAQTAVEGGDEVLHTDGGADNHTDNVDLDRTDMEDEVMADGMEDEMGRYNNYNNSRWSLSPESSNPFLSDLVAASPFSRSPDPEASSPPSMRYQDTDSSECVVCGKDLSHLDSGRIAFHVNTCIDEQQEEQNAQESLDLETPMSTTISASQGEFAGERVDYLARVKRCPICKQEWALMTNNKDKNKNSSKGGRKKARQKVEHVKRCAKAHNTSVQSLLYQMRLLKEKYERSLVLGNTDSIDAGQQSVEPVDESSVECHQDAGKGQGSEKSSVTSKASSAAAASSSKPTIIRKQVISLTDTADSDFTSDAIITTVNAPATTRPSHQSRITRIYEDQHDESFQLALAISMSMEGGSERGSVTGSRAGSPSSSMGGGVTTQWAMVPKTRGGPGGGGSGNKRRKRSEHGMNETTILPYSEIQELIQANVTALLFPDDDGFGHRSNVGATNAIEQGTVTDREQGLGTPPWRPSRFSSAANDVLASSQVSQTSPKASLWDLSHLKGSDDGVTTLALDESNNGGTHLEVECRSSQQHTEHSSVVVSTPKTSLAPVESNTFDRRLYISRFMREYLHREKGLAGNSRSSSPLEDDLGTEANGEQRPQDNDKFLSPLWSVAKKHRKISMQKGQQKKDRESAMVLEEEIQRHLEALEEQVQRVKKEAYTKIVASIEKHFDRCQESTHTRTLDRILASGQDSLRVDDTTQDGQGDRYGGEDHFVEMEDLVYTQETIDDGDDDYPRPLSPLLRYTKQSTMEIEMDNEEEVVEEKGKAAYSSPSRYAYSNGVSQASHDDPQDAPLEDDEFYGGCTQDVSFHIEDASPVGGRHEHQKQVLKRNDDDGQGTNDHQHARLDQDMDVEMEIHQDEDEYGDGFGTQGILVYSPPVSPRKDAPLLRVPPLLEGESGASNSNASQTQGSRDGGSFVASAEKSFSLSPVVPLPPRLDYAKLGFPGIAGGG
ncbi:Membrane-bound transcription factor site-2 protease [Podila epigama]|nr:Membrane-bound transcription factor site-2 protease [Podila epigama]